MKKIFPYLGVNGPTNSFKIIIAAEGYLAAEEAKFLGDCMELIDGIYAMPPFNLTKINPNWLSIYSSFSASANSGPAFNVTASTNRTRFETSFNSTTGVVSVNQQKVNDFINTATIQSLGSSLKLTKLCNRGCPSFGLKGTLIILLLPSFAAFPQGIEFENDPGLNDYYFVLVTKEKLWQQVVLRAICKTLGLSDEFELDGTAFLEPSTDAEKHSLHFNLQYNESTPNTIGAFFKWGDLLPQTHKQLPVGVHPKTVSTTTADNTIDLNPVLYTIPEYWEGGGGYRTKMYRSAKDCLLRRKIGSSLLPLRTKELALCPACRHYITTIIL